MAGAFRRYTKGKARKTYVSGGIPIPPEFINMIAFNTGMNEVRQFLLTVLKKFGRETYDLTIYDFQRKTKSIRTQFAKDIMQTVENANQRTYDALIARAKEQEKSSVSTPTFFAFSTNVRAIVHQQARFTEGMYQVTYRRAMDEFIPLVKDELKKVVEATANMQDQAAFPPEYKAPLLRRIDEMPMPERYGTRPFLAGIQLPNLFDSLGDIEDFRQAFSHKALLNIRKRRNTLYFEGKRLPERSDILKGRVYPGTLQQPLSERRYKYWRAVSLRQTSVVYRVVGEKGPYKSRSGKFTDRKNAVPNQTIRLPIEPGAWDETIQARLGVWGKIRKAPQWILLEFGQPKYKPTITLVSPPNNLTSQWYRALQPIWQRIVRKYWNQELERENNRPTPAPDSRDISETLSAIQPNYTKITGLIRVFSQQYGTSYYSESEYLNRRLGNFFMIGDNWVRTNELEIYRTGGKRKGYI